MPFSAANAGGYRRLEQSITRRPVGNNLVGIRGLEGLPVSRYLYPLPVSHMDGVWVPASTLALGARWKVTLTCPSGGISIRLPSSSSSSKSLD